MSLYKNDQLGGASVVEVLKQLLYETKTQTTTVTSTGDASSANQLLQLTALTNILNELRDDVSFSETIWVDKNTNIFYVRLRTINQDTGAVAIVWQDVNGSVVTPPSIPNLVQTELVNDYELSVTDYRVITAFTNAALDDLIKSIDVVNTSNNTVITFWRNVTQSISLPTPTLSNLEPFDDALYRNGTQRTQITNGTLNASLTASNTAAVATNIALVTSTSPNSVEFQNEFGTPASKATLTGAVHNNVEPIYSNGTATVLQADSNGKLLTAEKNSDASLVQEQAINLKLANLNDKVDDANDSLVSINNKLASPLPITLGNDVSANSTSVTIASDDVHFGIENTGILQVNTGTGIKGWLSGTYKRLNDTYTNTTSWFTKITDGTNNAVIKPASTAPLVTDAAFVVVKSPNSPDLGTVGAGTAATKSSLAGGVYNSTFPTLSTGQQSALQVDSNGRLIQSIGASSYILSAGNTSTVNLAAGATFTGTIQDVLSAPAAVVSVLATQNTTINILQYSDLAGTRLVETTTFTRGANAPLNTPIKLSGSYFRVTVQNTGGTATTTFLCEAWLGVLETLPTSLTNTGNLRTAILEALPTGTNSIGNIALVAANQDAPNTSFTDVASAAITTSTTTGAITPTWGTSYQITIPVTAVTGTAPTMSVQVQESNDSGTNWYTVYTFPTITVTGTYVSPKLNLKGNRVRYVQTITGTTPSFTRSVLRMQSNEIVPVQGGIPIITNGTITTGGTSQTGVVHKFNRNYLEIQNNSAGDLWFNFNTNAGVNTGFKLIANGSWSCTGGTCPESSVTIFGATTGQAFAIAEF